MSPRPWPITNGAGRRRLRAPTLSRQVADTPLWGCPLLKPSFASWSRMTRGMRCSRQPACLTCWRHPCRLAGGSPLVVVFAPLEATCGPVRSSLLGATPSWSATLSTSLNSLTASQSLSPSLQPRSPRLMERTGNPGGPWCLRFVQSRRHPVLPEPRRGRASQLHRLGGHERTVLSGFGSGIRSRRRPPRPRLKFTKQPMRSIGPTAQGAYLHFLVMGQPTRRPPSGQSLVHPAMPGGPPGRVGAAIPRRSVNSA